MTLFHLQLITSFLVGGSFVALLSFAAERIPSKIAGIVLMLPSTLALGYLFIAWTIGPEHIHDVITPSVGVMGIVMIFITTYLYLSKIKLPKVASILVCLTGSLSMWFGLSIIFTLLGVTTNLLPASISFVVGTTIAITLISAKTHSKSKLPPIKYSSTQKLIRAIFAGLVITTAVYLAKTLGPVWGGVFATFPAVFTSTLTALHWYYDSPFLFKTVKVAPFGNIAFISFIVASYFTFPAFGALGGFLTAYAICIPFYALIAKLTSSLSS